MSVTIHPRETGATIRCDQCKHTLFTGQVQKGLIRSYAASYAASLGWIRGLTKPKRRDICPVCAPAERARCDELSRLATERRAARDENRKARYAVLTGAA